MVPICEIIGQVLSSSSAIKSIDLSDCMLLSKGIGFILNALCEGSNITSLNLKGNNINGPTVAQLGQVLVHNNTLKILNIEWNSVGSHVDSFVKFCDGLTKNHNIEELDLRYNQISPYCAEALAKVLRLNKSLMVLDLAWNTIGLQGGQLLLAGIDDNKKIVRLNLHGNCIPNDIVQSIDDRARNNKSRQMITSSGMSKGIEKAKSAIAVEKSRILPITESDSSLSVNTRQRYRRKKKRRGQSCPKEIVVGESASVTDNSLQKSDAESENCLGNFGLVVADVCTEKGRTTNDVLMKCNKEGSDNEAGNKIKELNQILEDRTTAINLLTNEIAVKSAEIEAVRSQSDQLRFEIDRLKEERDKLSLDKTKEINDLNDRRKEAEEKWEKLYKETEEAWRNAVAHKKESDVKIRRYERDIHKSSVEIGNLKEKIITLTQTYEDIMSKDKTETHRLKREIKERDNRHKNEINIVKNTLRETTKALEDCQEQLQKSRLELRDVSESHIALKTRINEMEHINVRYSRSEETLNKIKEENDNLAEKLTDTQRVANNLQRQVIALKSELIEPQRRYELLNVELTQEKEKSFRLKEELIEERNRTKEQNVQIQKMALQISALNTQISDIQSSHAETLRERDKERIQLRETIAIKERDINEMKSVPKSRNYIFHVDSSSLILFSFTELKKYRELIISTQHSPSTLDPEDRTQFYDKYVTSFLPLPLYQHILYHLYTYFIS